MTAIEKALSDLREARSSIKTAYQSMEDPAAAQGGPPMDPAAAQQMDPAAAQQMAAAQGGPPIDPAAMQQAQAGGPPPGDPAAGGPPQGGPPGAAVDPQVIMELMQSLEQVGSAMQSLSERVKALESEHKRMAHEVAKSQGEQALLIKLIKEQSAMGPEVTGASPAGML